MNTDYSNVSVGKVLDTREAEIVDIDKLIDELSDIDDLSGLSSSTSENSDESESSKKKKSDQEPKAKRRRRHKKQDDSDDDSESNNEGERKITDPNEIRNKMVQHLEQMRLAKQKMKKSKDKKKLKLKRFILNSSDKSKRSTATTLRKRPLSTVKNSSNSFLNLFFL